MTASLYLCGSRHPRPAARRVVFCDGSADTSFRNGVDLELSHWIPNRTPAAYRASSSTEICMRFAAARTGEPYDLVVNNHVDVDGMLSAFVLLHPELALQHRDAIVQAAEMGDFSAWGEIAAQRLFQVLALARQRLEAAKLDPQDIVLQCHALALRVLGGEAFAEADEGLAALRAAVERIDAGAVGRTVLGARLVHFAIPAALAAQDRDAALRLPPLDTPLDSRTLLPPQARARLDAERLQLVSVAVPAGWHFDLCYPGYSWADTEGLWRPPGLLPTGSSNLHHLIHAPLDLAAGELDRRESAAGSWTVARALSPFDALPGRGFPSVLAFTRDQLSVPSALAPEVVCEVLQMALGAGPD